MINVPITISGVAYRVRRSDKLNVAIEKLRGSTWQNFGYYGNSVQALSRGLMSLIVANWSPESDDGLVEQVRALQDSIDTCATEICVALKGAELE